MSLRVGLLSFAHVHASGLATLLSATGVEVLAGDDDLDRGRQGAAATGARFVGDVGAVLEGGVDAVVICAENARHRELTERAAAAGAWVLTEKPLATTDSDGEAMIRACERAGVGLMVAFPMRFAPPVVRAVDLARSGALGRIAALSGANPGTCPGGWFVDPALSGGGALIDHTVHLVDLMCWITGAEPARVYACTNRLIGPEHGVETGGQVQVTFSDGTFAALDASWSRLPSYPVWGGLTLEVVGTDGAVSVDAFGEQFLATSDTTRLLRFGVDPNRAMLAEFVASVRERRAPAVTGMDGLRATAVALAAYRSAASGQPVEVDRRRWPAGG